MRVWEKIDTFQEDPPSPELTPEEVLLRQERQTAL